MNYRVSIQDALTLAASKVGVEGWEGYVWEAFDSGCIVSGEVPDGVYTRGPRKGRPRFHGRRAATYRRVVVAESELQQAAMEHERETGQCWECKGTGKAFAGWSAGSGTKYVPCERCAATGVAPQP